MYCFDVKPTSRDDLFLRQYFDIEDHIDYLIFSEDQNYTNGQYFDSEFGGLLKDLVFKIEGQELRIEEITLKKKKLNELNEFMNQYSDEYDLSDIAMLPKELVSIGEVKVFNETSQSLNQFIFIVDDFNINMISARNKDEKEAPN